ncbi:MAG: tagaturonate reductase [Atopobiaceae bacterium]|jgi:tagaturonate reductase|nr:tagaturonate reductase [Atopobiaceae bacterium]MCH4179844.1 tagaturonate reductase [Atopobiaceae bacterium]MCH4213595.1 tagaturonate reductase [Atopobiaceae bacterium]MCH4229600.1 tagaturonate reductase [Atopobiaceae bacterium]MCH4276243.1 tagaturonate reductase [Atopobiaceae bacterium]
MRNLSYKTLNDIGYQGYLLEHAPEKVLQFGDGNFLRAFVEGYVDRANERTGWNGKVVMVQAHERAAARADALNEQDGLYTVHTRGTANGAKVDEMRVISCVSRCINPYRTGDYLYLMEVACSSDLELVISNTTEAGIVYDDSCEPYDEPPASFPARLTQVLYARWRANLPGVIVLSCELIDHNGAKLRECVGRYARQWGWDAGFERWLDVDCTFCTTLVDSIVPGAVRDPDQAAALDERAGFHDALADVREPFDLWGIEGTADLEDRLPFKAAGLDTVFVTKDVSPYKRRKVRILNGAHTAFVPCSYLAGFDIVRDCMHDEAIRTFMDGMLQEEVIPTLVPALEQSDCEAFAAAVADRFDNPFIDHQLLSICLNSVSKWKARDLPTLLDYVEGRHDLPRRLTFSLAALIAFYTRPGGTLEEDGIHLTREDGDAYVATDNRDILELLHAHATDEVPGLVQAVLGDEGLWDTDLTDIPGLADLVAADLTAIRTDGPKAALVACTQTD